MVMSCQYLGLFTRASQVRFRETHVPRIRHVRCLAPPFNSARLARVTVVQAGLAAGVRPGPVRPGSSRLAAAARGHRDARGPADPGARPAVRGGAFLCSYCYIQLRLARDVPGRSGI
jgi:hypothetical protein